MKAAQKSAPLIPSLFILLAASLTLTIAHSADKNGFDLDKSLIPSAEIHQGGPPRDGIPAINKPKFIKARKADFLHKNDRVLGLSRNGRAKAYPIAIMNWHEIVNDTIGGEAVVITFCPLCGTGVAFSAHVANRKLDFGVSGLLYNSDVLLYDRQTESLWSQLLGQAISGTLKGTKLKPIVLEHTRWGDWQQRHPSTQVLSTDTGSRRDYKRDPYAGYENSQGIYFPVAHKDPRYHPKERVLGLEINGRFKAYPFSELSQLAEPVVDSFDGQQINIHYDKEHQSARAFNAQGDEIATITSFWFAWYAFHPDTAVYTAP